MTTPPLINEKILWALTEEAALAVKQMMMVGMDKDLALSVLEQLWPEEAVYNLSGIENE